LPTAVMDLTTITSVNKVVTENIKDTKRSVGEIGGMANMMFVQELAKNAEMEVAAITGMETVIAEIFAIMTETIITITTMETETMETITVAATTKHKWMVFL